MPVTKRTRYEVLKRDNHTCRYCGGVVPDVILTVDHVTPVALGGSDDPNNLVAACQDCNYGKASTSPDADTVAQVADDAVRWARAVQQAASEMQEASLRHAGTHEKFADIWMSWDKDYSSLPRDAWTSIDGWLDAGLPESALLESAEIAISNRSVAHNNVFRYMGGIIRNKLAAIHERARAIVDAEASDGS